MKVTIIDTRPKWVIQEDGQYHCRTFCKMYKICASRIGQDCKRQGGTEIPKIRSKRK